MIIGPVRCGTLRALCSRQAKAKRTYLSRVKIGVEEVHRQTTGSFPLRMRSPPPTDNFRNEIGVQLE